MFRGCSACTGTADRGESPWILGISASHNGAYCLIHGDEIVVAIQDERLVRRKRSRVFGARPSVALHYCLDAAAIGVGDLSMIVLSAQRASDTPDNDLSLHPSCGRSRTASPTTCIPHHLAHAMSAYATSGFRDCAVLVIDGLGSPWHDLTPGERAVARGADANGCEVLSTYAATPRGLEAIDKHLVPDSRWLLDHADTMWGFRSLGGMFSAAAELMFGDPMEAGKVMGLAPYGTATLPVGAFFSIEDGLLVFGDEVPARFPRQGQGQGRWPACSAEYADLAASTQAALEHAVLAVSRRLQRQIGAAQLCCAGGVALNGIANQRLLRERVFRDLHVIPAAEDSGAAIGAAYWGLAQLTGELRSRRQTRDATGRSYTRAQIDDAIARTPAIEVVPCDDLLTAVVDRLCAGEIGGWFEGGSELGPRALGQRSIPCDARRPDAKDVLNRRVKGREPFRPFAPAVALEHVEDWFDLEGTLASSPFMLRVCRIRESMRARVPGVVHVDGTGRLQNVERGSRFTPCPWYFMPARACSGSSSSQPGRELAG